MTKLGHFIRKFEHYLLPLLVSLLALATCFPLLRSGFFSFHDFQHVARLFELDKALWAGQFPVRFVSGLGFGYGYALFNFYPPFIYYLGEFFHLLGFGFVDAIKLVWATALIGSALTMYLLTRELWGKAEAVFCSVLYLYIPYHAVDAYVRGALAELFSFVWLPLILLFSFRLLRTEKNHYILGTAVTLGLLMITHNLIFLPFFGLFTAWYFGISLIYKRNLIRSVLWFTLTTLLAFGLSAFFWLPALAEKQFTLVDQLLLKNLASYTIHFVCPDQLWNSLWGYGGSAVGCIDGISFKIGKIHIGLAAFTLIISFGMLFRKGDKRTIFMSSLSLLIAAISIFMTVTNSAFVWQLLSPLWYLQFPWRFLEFVALFLSMGVGILPTFIKQPVIKVGVIVAIIFLVMWQNTKLFAPQFYFPDWTDSVATSNQEIMERVSSSSFEFLPAGIATHFDEKGDLKVNVGPGLSNRSEVVIGDTKAKVKEKVIFPNFWRVEVETTQDTTVQFPIAVFPGWQATVNGKKTAIDTDNDLKLLTIPVSTGKYTIIVEFKDTLVRTLANLLTLASTIVLVVIWYESRRSQTKTN